jgi:hypothetical protein
MEKCFSAAEVDPILWTKKGRSLATLLPAFLTGNVRLHLLLGPACRIDLAPGETEVGSAGEHPAKGYPGRRYADGVVPWIGHSIQGL